MTKAIKFGTDGWRAIIADDFTVDNVRRVAQATAIWVKGLSATPSITLGHDCRFGGELFARTAAEVFASNGIKVNIAQGFVSTPMISLAALKLKAHAGIIITASHNPPSYNGFKIKASYGGPATPEQIEAVEKLIPEKADKPAKSFDDYVNDGLVVFADFEKMYLDDLRAKIDLKAIEESHTEMAYDAMFGAGQQIMRELFPNASLLHCDDNPGFLGQAPEPIHKNLSELSELIRISGDIDLGLATDGDADRIGLYNKEGRFIDSHHIILLLIQYLHKYKNLNGKVVNSFSCSQKISKLCQLYGLEQTVTKIGFKYICEYMINEDVLVGAEESGGLAIKGHIPERDGIWIGLTIWEYMSKTGKSLDELIQEVYALVGPFAVERYDLHIREDQKQQIIAACKSGQYKQFGNYTIERTEDLDGYKYHLGNDRWVMIRPSGTEPVLRVYAEAASSDEAFAILEATKQAILY